MASEISAATTADKLEDRIWKDVEAKVDEKLSAELTKKGNEKQYVFNEHVRDKIDAAASALQQSPPAVDKALAVLQEITVPGGDDLLQYVYHKDVKKAISALTEGTNPNYQDPRDGNTALHIAVTVQSEDLVKLLIVFDADLTVKNHNGQTALEIANSEGATKIAEDIGKILHLQNELDTDQPKNLEFLQWTPEDILMLSLDGGGIRGLVLVQVLIEMEKRRKKLYPNAQRTLLSNFNWVTGNSTGGIAALAFTAAQKGAVEGRKLYFHLKDKILGCEPPIPNERVDAVFKNLYGAHKTMSQIKCKQPIQVSVMTTLANKSPPVLHIMSNYGGTRNFQDPPEKQLVWKAARATSSVPIFFHPQDEKYIDGGLIANNPTSDAIIDMFDYATKEGKNLKLKLVLSLGCGLIKPECIEDIDFDHELSSGDKAIAHIIDMLDKHKLGEHADELLLILKNFKAFKQLMDVVSAQITQPNGEVLKRSEFISKRVGAHYFRIDPPIPKVGFLSTDDKQLIDMLYEVVYYMLKNCHTVTDPILEYIYTGKI